MRLTSRQLGAWGIALIALPLVVTACGGSPSGAPSGDSTRVLLSSTTSSTRDADAALLTLLTQRGAHLARPRSTRLYIDFPTQADARTAATEIPRAYSVAALGKTGSGGRYELRLTTVMVITLDSIGRREAALSRLAGRHHGALDGWEAAPTP